MSVEATRLLVEGTLVVSEAQPGTRYTGTLTVRLRDGQVSGTFDVTPRPD
jgi:hypothetical protein